jgi:hypothetical protein
LGPNSLCSPKNLPRGFLRLITYRFKLVILHHPMSVGGSNADQRSGRKSTIASPPKAQAAADTQADKTQTAYEAKTAVKAPALQQTQSGRAELTAAWRFAPPVLTLQCGVDQRSCPVQQHTGVGAVRAEICINCTMPRKTAYSYFD